MMLLAEFEFISAKPSVKLRSVVKFGVNIIGVVVERLRWIEALLRATLSEPDIFTRKFLGSGNVLFLRLFGLKSEKLRLGESGDWRRVSSEKCEFFSFLASN